MGVLGYDVFALVQEEEQIVVRFWEDPGKPFSPPDEILSQVFSYLQSKSSLGIARITPDHIALWFSWNSHDIPLGFIAYLKPPFDYVRDFSSLIPFALERIKNEFEINVTHPPAIPTNVGLASNKKDEQMQWLLASYLESSILNSPPVVSVPGHSYFFELLALLISTYPAFLPINAIIPVFSQPPIATEEQPWCILVVDKETKINAAETTRDFITEDFLNFYHLVLSTPQSISETIQLYDLLSPMFENREIDVNSYLTNLSEWILTHHNIHLLSEALKQLRTLISFEATTDFTILSTLSDLLLKAEKIDDLRLLNGEIAMAAISPNLPHDLRIQYIELLFANSEQIGKQDLLAAMENLSTMLPDSEMENIRNIFLSKLVKLMESEDLTIEDLDYASRFCVSARMYDLAIDAKIRSISLYSQHSALNRVSYDVLAWLIEQPIPTELLSPQISRIGETTANHVQTEEEAVLLVQQFCSALLSHEKIELIEPLIASFIQHLNPQISRQKIIDAVLETVPTELRLGKLVTTLFLSELELALNNHDADLSIRMIRRLYNEIDPSRENFDEAVLDLSKRILRLTFISGFAPAIEEIYTRMQLFLGPNIEDVFSQLVISTTKDLFNNSESFQAPLVLQALQRAKDYADKSKNEELLYEILDLILKVAARYSAGTTYLSTLSEKALLLEQKGLSSLSLYKESIANLADLQNLELAKQVIHVAMQKYGDNLSQKAELFEAILLLPPSITHALVTPSELLEYRKTTALLKSEKEGPEATIAEFMQGIQDLNSRGDHDLVRQFVLEAVKFARTHGLEEQISSFIKALRDSYDASLKAYAKIGSQILYFDLIKNLRLLLTEVFLAKEGSEAFEYGLSLAKTDLALAERKAQSVKFQEKSIALQMQWLDKNIFKHIYQALELIDELTTLYTKLHPSSLTGELFKEFATAYLQGARLYAAILQIPQSLSTYLLVSYLVSHNSFELGISHLSGSSGSFTTTRKFKWGGYSVTDAWIHLKSWYLLSIQVDKMTQQELKLFAEGFLPSLEHIRKAWKKQTDVIKIIDRILERSRSSFTNVALSLPAEIENILKLMEMHFNE